VAINPATGGSLGANSSVAIRTIVPTPATSSTADPVGAGSPTRTTPGLRSGGPRIGAYDLTGTQKMVVRGASGFLRPPENNMTANESAARQLDVTTLRYAQLQTLGRPACRPRAGAVADHQ
jgi:hypothetical protein